MKFIKTKGEDEVHISDGCYWRIVSFYLFGIELYSRIEEFDSDSGEWKRKSLTSIHFHDTI